MFVVQQVTSHSLSSVLRTMTLSAHHREIILQMHKNGKSVPEILAAVHPLISRRTVYRLISRSARGLPLTAKTSCGRPRIIRTPKAVEAVRSRLRRSSRRNLTKMASQMAMSRRSLSRIVHEDLNMSSYKSKEREALTEKQRRARVVKAPKLKRVVGVRNICKIIFTDEKIFSLDETGAHPLVKFHCPSSKRYQESLKCGRSSNHHSPGIMVWGGVSKLSKTPLIFVEPGAKVNAEYYQNNILLQLKTWCTTALNGVESITLQQDWAPAHRARSTKSWLRNNQIHFLDEDLYPAASPDLNPMDYSIWGWMLQCLSEKNLQTVEELKVAVTSVWESLPQDAIDQAIDQLPHRLDMLLAADGRRFE
jgi:inhibitor of nuclear factor kappa-B kinase subunit alpha